MLLPALVLLSLWAALPDSVPSPKGVSVVPENLSEHTYDELVVLDGKARKPVRGHAWAAWFAFDDGQSHPAAETWRAWLPLLAAKGWKVSGDDENQHSLVRLEGKTEWRLTVTLADYDQPRVRVVRVGGAPLKLTAKAPVTPLQVKDSEDYPFAPKLPGFTLTGTSAPQEGLPLTMHTPNEVVFLADSSQRKTYAAVRSLSRLEFVLAFAQAFQAAGWTVALTDAENGVFFVHYTKEGKDVWFGGGNADDGTDQAIAFSVADVGHDLGRALTAKDCRIALRGVTFEFNKATLKPDADGALQAVAEALEAHAAVKVEVAGHTDNVGDEAFNQKLSEQRVATVKGWLTAHGVADARLTSRGYGKNNPVTTNDTDEGRAKNRRVELVCAK